MIVSADGFNRSAANMVAVLPLTTSLKLIRLRVRIDPPEAGLRKSSQVQCDQLRVISVERLVGCWGTVSRKTMRAVEEDLKLFLDLT